MGIVVIGDVFIDIKGYSTSPYIPQGRNAGTILQIHGGVGRNVSQMWNWSRHLSDWSIMMQWAKM